MENIVGNIINYVLALIGIIIVIGIVSRTLINVFSKEKSTNAVLVDKQCYDKRIYSKGQAPYTKKEYVITFLCGDNKKHFNVSELSYKNYRVNQKGILKYKGNQIINFK